ncbi:RPM1 interacting protein 13 [Argentina anserina]|uniref:RPM1 interacting protein 13 n=1 Tax=Argentina anserina TaxID=57926 RepID=UPI0021762B7A|nr:RPM1 interacting protein 13 [Potentilla anserina]
MNSGPIDISSDEEEDDAARHDVDDDSVDWLSNLIESAESKFENDADSDDVMVIGEVNAGSKCAAKEVDDDCVVLDGDPDEANSVEDSGSGSGSDDLVVVGEKGQVACRDYPHPRHLCAKFPFTSTPHEKYCDLCHCYVCDSLAPCVHWGTGASHIGHCHATEKVDMWKVLRRNFKMGRSASMPAIKVSLSVSQISQVPPLDIIRLAPNSIPQTQVYRSSTNHTASSARPVVPAATSIPLNQVPRSTLIRACPSTNLINSTVSSLARRHQQRFVPSNNGVQPASVQPSSASQQLLNNAQRSSRAHTIGGSLHSTSSPTMFKRVGPVRGSLAKNQSAYGSTYNSNSVNPSQYGPLNNSGYANPSQYGRIPSPRAASNNGVCFSWQEVHNSLNPMPSQPMGSGIVGSAVPPQPYSPPLPQSAYSQTVQPGSQILNNGQNFCQYGVQSQNASQNVSLQGVGASAVDLGFSDCNYSWMNNTSQSIQQPQPPIEISQVQSTEAMFGPAQVKEPDYQSNEYPNLKGLESDFDNWLLDNQPIPPVTNDSVTSQLDQFYPGPPLVDSGMLYFDFETSFNSPTQV